MLAGVPRFMTKEQQFELLSLFIPSMLQQPLVAVRGKRIHEKNLHETFCEFVEKINSSDFQLQWFVSATFTSEEINELKEVVRYALLKSAAKTYAYMVDDIRRINRFLQSLSMKAKAMYTAEGLGLEVRLSGESDSSPTALSINTDIPDLVSRFREQFQQHLLKEALEEMVRSKASDNAQAVALSDLAVLGDHFHALMKDAAFDSSVEVRGRSGIVHIDVRWKDLTALKRSKLEFTALGVILIILVILGWPLITLFEGFGILISIIVLGVTWVKVIELNREIEEYERSEF